MICVSCGREIYPGNCVVCDSPLRETNAALLEALRGLVSGEEYRFMEDGDAYTCVYCGRMGHGRDLHHEPCPVVDARAAIAQAEKEEAS